MKLLVPDGRKALLEFLRNLTPQILLLSSAIVLVVGAGKPEAMSPMMSYALAGGLFIVWLLAFFANFENFLDSSFSDSKFVSAERRRVILTEKSPLKRIGKLLYSIAKHSKITFVELLLAMVIIYVSMFTVLISAIGGVLKISN